MMVISGIVLARPIALAFSNGNQDLIDLTIIAMTGFSFSFAFCGFSMFISNFFTGLGNGAISGIISFFRTFVFQVLAILLLPVIFNSHDALWYYGVAQEGLAFILSFILHWDD